MEQFNFLSYEYYNTFYSYKGYLTKFTLHIPTTFIFALLFAFALVDFSLLIMTGENILSLEKHDPFNLVQNNYKNLPNIYSLGLVSISEIVFLLLYLSLNSRKEKETILRVSEKLNAREKTLRGLKRRWLLRVFKQKPHEYLTVTESAIKSYEIIDNNKPPFEFSRNRFYKIFYEETAKTRILSLLIAFISIISIIALKGQNNSENLFKEIYYTSTSDIVFLLFIMTIFLKLTLLMMKQISVTAVTLIESFNAYIDIPSARNEYISKMLIRDLIRYSNVEINTSRTKSTN